jgi:hypothetical protein
MGPSAGFYHSETYIISQSHAVFFFTMTISRLLYYHQINIKTNLILVWTARIQNNNALTQETSIYKSKVCFEKTDRNSHVSLHRSP